MMEKLNELVEQAKFVADWHGSDWSSALCQDKDGKQAHEVICESRGEAVISTGSNSKEASWLCDYLELCSPENILAIAEAFRALEQKITQERIYVRDLNGSVHEWKQRAEAAEADVKRMDWLCSHCVEVRYPLMYGSREMFRAQQDSEEWDLPHHTKLREQVDEAMRNIEGDK